MLVELFEKSWELVMLERIRVPAKNAALVPLIRWYFFECL